MTYAIVWLIRYAITTVWKLTPETVLAPKVQRAIVSLAFVAGALHALGVHAVHDEWREAIFELIVLWVASFSGYLWGFGAAEEVYTAEKIYKENA